MLTGRSFANWKISAASFDRVPSGILLPSPRMRETTNCSLHELPTKCERALRTMPTLVVSTTELLERCPRTHLRLLSKISSSHSDKFACNCSGCLLIQAFSRQLVCMSSSERKIIPMRLTVAGEANRRSFVSKMKLTLGPNRIRSPLGIVRRRLSSSTEFSDSTHSGSISPSQIIQLRTSGGSLTTFRALAVSTPSNHSRVSRSICPRSCSRFMALGFIVCTTIDCPKCACASFRIFSSVDLPQPLGPTITQPIRWFKFSFSCTTFLT